MKFSTSVPTRTGTPVAVELKLGECLFLLGANGTGKSGLMHKFARDHPEHARRISAHRQTWFASSLNSMSSEQKRQAEDGMRIAQGSIESRWKDSVGKNLANLAIYDLIHAENVRARAIAGAFEVKNFVLAEAEVKAAAPLREINELLRLSSMHIQISVTPNEEIVARRDGGQPYPASELSDGERNALLIAATVLTAPANSLLLIDEPERHLHRSIISPLVTLLVARRTDCAFVISTHDVMLPVDNPTAKTLLVRDCFYKRGTHVSWDADLVSAHSDIDEQLKREILGSRRDVLFVEGDAASLDSPLFAIVFPDTSVVPKGNCRGVIQAVSGVRGATDIHWIRAFGLIDNDGRGADEIERLKNDGIYALPVYSVESIYYHPRVQRLAAERLSKVTGTDLQQLLDGATNRAVEIVAAAAHRMCERTVERLVRDQIETQIPNSRQIAARQPVSISIDVAALISAERATFDGFVARMDLAALIARYPVRETGVLATIAERLQFTGREQYESTVRKMLLDDPSALEFVQNLFADLVSALKVR